MKVILNFINFILVFCTLFSASLLLFQRRMIYFPRRYDPGFERVLPPQAKAIRYRTGEGEQTSFYLPPKNGHGSEDGTLWFVFSGNASWALDWLDFAARYPDPAASFLLFDYPGYGASEGKATSKSILESAEKAIHTLAAELRLETGELIRRTALFGQSLGAATGLLFAAKHELGRVVLLSPFTSLLEMAKRRVGRPFCYLLLDNFDNVARLREIAGQPKVPPITVVHGDRDDVIPVEMGRWLGKEFGDKVRYLEVKGGDHNGILGLAENRIVEAMLGR